MKVNFKNTTVLRVRYGETDQMGYCYYGNYAQYFEVGRVETMRSIGISYKEMEAKGIMLPVSEYQVSYFIPAKYDEILSIQTTVEYLKGPRLFFSYEVFNEVQELVAKASTMLVFVSATSMQPTKPPMEFIRLIENIKNP